MTEQREVRAQLGCWTLILIALIVFFFSGSHRVEELESKVDDLAAAVGDLSEEIGALRSEVAGLRQAVAAGSAEVSEGVLERQP